jgi:hypothetical protein
MQRESFQSAGNPAVNSIVDTIWCLNLSQPDYIRQGMGRKKIYRFAFASGTERETMNQLAVAKGKPRYLYPFSKG